MLLLLGKKKKKASVHEIYICIHPFKVTRRRRRIIMFEFCFKEMYNTIQ